MKKLSQLLRGIVLFIVLIRGTGTSHVHSHSSSSSRLNAETSENDVTDSEKNENDGGQASLSYVLSQFSKKVGKQIDDDLPTLGRVLVEEILHQKLVSTKGKCKKRTIGVAHYLVNEETAGETKISFVVKQRAVHEIEIQPCLTEMNQEMLGNSGKEIHETQELSSLHPTQDNNNLQNSMLNPAEAKLNKNRKRFRRNDVRLNLRSLNEAAHFLDIGQQRVDLVQEKLETASAAEQTAQREKFIADTLAEKVTRNLNYLKENVTLLNNELLKLKKLTVQLLNKVNGKNDTANTNKTHFETNITNFEEEIKNAMANLDAERKNSAAINETRIECEEGKIREKNEKVKLLNQLESLNAKKEKLDQKIANCTLTINDTKRACQMAAVVMTLKNELASNKTRSLEENINSLERNATNCWENMKTILLNITLYTENRKNKANNDVNETSKLKEEEVMFQMTNGTFPLFALTPLYKEIEFLDFEISECQKENKKLNEAKNDCSKKLNVSEQTALREKSKAENSFYILKENVTLLNNELLKSKKLTVQLLNKVNGKNDTANTNKTNIETNITNFEEEIKNSMAKLDAERKNSAAINETKIECEQGRSNLEKKIESLEGNMQTILLNISHYTEYMQDYQDDDVNASKLKDEEVIMFQVRNETLQSFVLNSLFNEIEKLDTAYTKCQNSYEKNKHETKEKLLNLMNQINICNSNSTRQDAGAVHGAKKKKKTK